MCDRRSIIEVNRDIEYCKGRIDLARTEDELNEFKFILTELRDEKKDIWEHLFD